MDRKNKPSTWIGMAVSAAVCLLIFLTTDDYGLTWDEPEYMRAGAAYVEWLKHPVPDAIGTYWRINHEHPPLIKLMGGLSMELFTRRLNLLDATRAFRLPVLIFVFALCLFLFIYGSGCHGIWIGLFIGCGFFLMPRIFFHAHIGAMDFPIAALWFMTVLALNKAIADARWRYPAAMLIGLALLTKIHGLFLYFPAALALGFHLKQSGSHGDAVQGSSPGISRRAAIWAWPLLVIPPVMFLMGWPWLWEAPVQRLAEYFTYHIRHGHTPTFYFGRPYLAGPWHLPFVLFFTTLPLTILIPFLIGLFFPLRRTSGHVLMLFSLALAVGLIAVSPSKHDGVRLFLPAFPFACVLAGEGLARFRDILKTPMRRTVFAGAMAILFALEIIRPTVLYHPYQTAYFNPLMGGARGALHHGLEFHYWCESYRELLPWIDRNPDAAYWIPIAPHLFQTYHYLGLLRKPLRMENSQDADYLILPARFGMFNDGLFDCYRNHKPAFAVRRMGVVLAGIYSLRDKAAGKKSLMDGGDL